MRIVKEPAKQGTIPKKIVEKAVKAVIHRQANEFQCPSCKYGFYASKDNFYMLGQAVPSYDFISGRKDNGRWVYACPECGTVFMDIREKNDKCNF